MGWGELLLANEPESSQRLAALRHCYRFHQFIYLILANDPSAPRENLANATGEHKTLDYMLWLWGSKMSVYTYVRLNSFLRSFPSTTNSLPTCFPGEVPTHNSASVYWYCFSK